MVVKLLLIISILFALGWSNDQLDGKHMVIQQNFKEPLQRITGGELRRLFPMRRDVTAKESEVNPEAEGLYPFPKQALQQKVIRYLFTHLNKTRMENFVKNLSAFEGRNQHSWGDDQSEFWLTKEIKQVCTAYDKVGYNYQILIKDPTGSGRDSYEQASIIAGIYGQDATLSQTRIILGAHYDTRGSGRRPGADDNASGCAVLMEMLRIIVQFRLKFNYTIEFHFYTASEGQRGSRDVVSKFKQEGKTQIRGMLNLARLGFSPKDERNMVGFVDRLVLKSGEIVQSPRLTYFVKMLSLEYLDYKMKAVSCLYNNLDWCKSDFIPWHQENHPWAAVTEPTESWYRNSERDTIDTLIFEQVNEFAKIALAFVIELGELAELAVLPEVTTKPSPASSSALAVEPQLGIIFIISICHLY